MKINEGIVPYIFVLRDYREGRRQELGEILVAGNRGTEITRFASTFLRGYNGRYRPLVSSAASFSEEQRVTNCRGVNEREVEEDGGM